MSTNCTAYNEMKYYLAFKKERSNKWKVQPQAFLLHYTSSHLTGQFITTMWYNQLIIDSEPIQYAILEVKKDATSMEKHMVLDRLNQGDTSDVIFKSSIARDQLRDAFTDIDARLNTLKTENMDPTQGAPCKTYTLKMDHNSGILLNLTMQGTWNTVDPDKHHYTITLPMFQKTI